MPKLFNKALTKDLVKLKKQEFRRDSYKELEGVRIFTIEVGAKSYEYLVEAERNADYLTLTETLKK